MRAANGTRPGPNFQVERVGNAEENARAPAGGPVSRAFSQHHLLCSRKSLEMCVSASSTNWCGRSVGNLGARENRSEKEMHSLIHS